LNEAACLQDVVSGRRSTINKGTFMKTFALLAATSLALVGCNQRQMDESAGAERSQIEQSKDAQENSLNQQKKSIEQSADQAKDQLSAQAKAEKERVESQADAQKAQIDAQKKQIEAQADAAKADVNAQKKIDEAAGATTTTPATPADQTATAQTQGAESSLAKQVRESLTSQNPSLTGVNIMEADGKVTLMGTVKTEAEKQSLEDQAKAVSGVTSVENKLEVKAE
jgi:osmotically-inducible protein OsmY